MTAAFQVHLSPPFLSGTEQEWLRKSIESGWVAPHGPQLLQFEERIAEVCRVPRALAVQSGTAALHLALLMAGVTRGDEVLCPTFTFAALPSMITLAGGIPVFVDCEGADWNMSLPLVEEHLRRASYKGKLPRALILPHNYGMLAHVAAFRTLCEDYEVVLIEDAAAAFAGTNQGLGAGAGGHFGTLSFNGNKLITTGGGGGALLLHSDADYETARKLSLQAKEAGVVYEHHTIGFNYRMSNLAASFGLAQLSNLEWRVNRKREIREFYLGLLKDVVTFQSAPGEDSVAWLTAVDLRTTWEPVLTALKAKGIESRPLWKPLHLQSAFEGTRLIGSSLAQSLFGTGLCLPSGLQITQAQQEEVCDTILEKATF